MSNNKSVAGNSPRLDLAGFLETAKAVALPMRTVEIDVSHMVGQPDGAFVITLRELDTARLFQIEADGIAVRKANPFLPTALATTIALLSLAHVGPVVEGMPIPKFYAQLAEGNKKVFMGILSRYKAEFPDSTDFGSAVDEAKND